MQRTKLGGCLLLATIFTFSAHAACGGGGYSPNKNKNSTATMAPSSSSVAAAPYNNTTVPLQTARYNNSSAVFDVSSFHNVSGKLHLTGEQATNVITAIQDIRHKLDENAAPPKDFDPKKEFEHRLASILNPEQLKTYQASINHS